jgi:diguanylate cyclase (GGDEF)-like protein
VQYIYFVAHKKRAHRLAAKLRSQADNLSGEVSQLNGEMQVLSRDRNLQRIENQLLREVLTQTECAKAVQALLRRFVPNPDDAFAVFLPCDPNGEAAAQCRGLSPDSFASLKCSAMLLNELSNKSVLIWDNPTPARCPIFGQLAPADRRKARQLFAFAVADDEGVLSVLFSTTLLPIAAPRQEQIDLTRRLMDSIAPSLRWNLNLEIQASQLRSTREMLELRSIADAKYDQPFGMLEQFLTRLGQMLDAERAALYLLTREGGGALKPIVRTGIQLQAGVAESWHAHEDRLAQDGAQNEQVSAFDATQLKCLGIGTLVGAAATAPILHNGNPIGVVCVTRRSVTAWSTIQRQLLGWSGETISQAIQRVMSFAVIERQARQDGLTGLANRRTFDAQLRNEIAGIKHGVQAECSLLLLDIDRFKSVNDIYGHQAGDEVLRNTSRALRDQASQIRSNDRVLLARYGGEELAVLLPGVGINGAKRIAEDIRLVIEENVTTFNGTPIRATVSIGVATWPLHAQTVESLVAAADGALYQAKSLGRNRVVCPTDSAESIKQMLKTAPVISIPDFAKASVG